MSFFDNIRSECVRNKNEGYKAVVRATTRKSYNALMLECDKAGIKWCSGNKASYKEENWNRHKEDTIIVFEFYRNNYKIDIMFGHTSDVKSLGLPNPIDISNLIYKAVDLGGLI